MKRFWDKVNKSGGCWIWLAGKDRKGYGFFWYEGKSMRAHRIAWMLSNGKIPEGLDVLHTCDNPPCCNPAHLFLGTNTDNDLDRDLKGRQARGERQGHSKLTERSVITIRKLYKDGISQARIAKKFNITPPNVSLIVNNKTWR